MDEAEQLADRICIVDHGEIIASGSPSELIKKFCGEQILHISLSRELAEKEIEESLPWFKDAELKESSYVMIVLITMKLFLKSMKRLKN